MYKRQEIDGAEESRVLIAQALTTYSLSTTTDRRATALSIVIPTLLKRAAAEGPDVYPDTSARLLDIAGKEQDTFRAIIGAFDTEQRTLVEEVLRAAPQAGQARRQGGVDAESAQPSIALKMNF